MFTFTCTGKPAGQCRYTGAIHPTRERERTHPTYTACFGALRPARIVGQPARLTGQLRRYPSRWRRCIPHYSAQSGECAGEQERPENQVLRRSDTIRTSASPRSINTAGDADGSSDQRTDNRALFPIRPRKSHVYSLDVNRAEPTHRPVHRSPQIYAVLLNGNDSACDQLIGKVQTCHLPGSDKEILGRDSGCKAAHKPDGADETYEKETHSPFRNVTNRGWLDCPGCARARARFRAHGHMAALTTIAQGPHDPRVIVQLTAKGADKCPIVALSQLPSPNLPR
jgi:hypothetical protein